MHSRTILFILILCVNLHAANALVVLPPAGFSFFASGKGNKAWNGCRKQTGFLHLPAHDSVPLSKYGLKTVSTMQEYRELTALDPRQEIVALERAIPGIKLDIRYATKNNFMNRPMYHTAAAFLRRPAADSLKAVQQQLKKKGYGLKIYDGYRPYRVTVAFYEAWPDTTFVASPYSGSRHNRGCAVDLTLIDLKTGKELIMPTPYDSFKKEAFANYPGANKKALANRKLLQDAMLTHGFVIYPGEWWHFDFAGWKQFPLMDLSFEELLKAPSDMY